LSRGTIAWTRLETLLKMHEEAFRQLGGVPEEILPSEVVVVTRYGEFHFQSEVRAMNAARF